MQSRRSPVIVSRAKAATCSRCAASFCSYADGTPVTVVGRDGAYKVLASRNYYNDAKEKQNMLFYFLERTDLAHKPTMLVADVHVQKVV